MSDARERGGGAGFRVRLQRQARAGLAAVLGAAIVFGGAVEAGESARPQRQITLELNRIDEAGQGCRLSFVMRNATGVAIEALVIELVLFDGAGQVGTLISIDPGRLPDNKTRVKQFDVPGLACAAIGRVLVNDVAQCTGEGLEPALCLAAIEASSRTGVPLVD